LEKEIKRVHKLSLPLIVERSGSVLTISDGMFEKRFEFKDFGKLRVTGLDSDGFVTFEVLKAQQQTFLEPILPRGIAKNGDGTFTHIGSGTAKSTSGSMSRGTYEYYKRVADEFYYASHKLGEKTKKIYLGSLQDTNSQIRRIIRTIQSFDDAWFDRNKLTESLSTPALKHGQKLKSALDILVLEGYLDRSETKKRGRTYEQYKKTAKMLSIK
jgi:hypothetical protein